MTSNKIIEFNYETDPLLIDNKLGAGNSINLYAVLIKKEDFSINKKGEILKKCPYIRDEDNEIKGILFKLDNKNFLRMRKLISKYMKIKVIEKKTMYRWINQRKYPLPLIRVLSLSLNKDVESMLKDKIITDFCNKSQIKLPTLYNEITSDFLAYLVGIHLGDGTLNKERWKVVDGDRETKNLKYSFDFLNKIKEKMEKVFSVKSDIYEIKGKRAYELIISNKWLCRYLNSVYGLEFGEKKKPRLPSILEIKKDLLFRGLMDTDGSIKGYRIAIGTKYRQLYEILRGILDEFKILYREKIIDVQRKNTFYILEIKKEAAERFIQLIGFSHPRKLIETINYLKTASASSIFQGYKDYSPKISEKEFYELCRFIRPIKNAGKVRFISKFSELQAKDKKRIITNLQLNFGVKKEPDKKGYVNSYKIERVMTNNCIFEKNRKPLNNEEIDKIVNKKIQIWM